MKVNMLIPVGMFVAGIALIVFAVATGDADVSLVLIIPVFTGSSATFLVGVLLLIGSFLVGFAMTAMGEVEQIQEKQVPATGAPEGAGKPRSEYGGVVLIGPIPIAFGSNRNVALAMLIVGIVIAVLMLGLLLAF